MNKAFILPRRKSRIRPYLDFTAMIDTVFNLLIFFAVISTFAGNGQHGIAMDLPKAKTSAPVVDRVVLALQPGQSPQINGRPVAMAEIGKVLEEVTRGEVDTQIVVMAGKSVPYATLVAALDGARQAGYHRLALATAPPDTMHTTPVGN